MENVSRLSSAPPGVLDLLRATWLVYRKNWLTITGYAAWLLLPYLGLVALSFLPADEIVISVFATICSLTQAVLWVWLLVVMIRLGNGLLHGKKGTSLKPEQQAWLIIPALAIASLLQLLIIAGGLILLIIPGLVFLVWYAFVQTIVVLEKKRPLLALTESRALVRGRFWSVAWRLAGGPVLLYLIFSVVFGVLAAFIASLTDVDPALMQSLLAAGVPPLWADIAATVLETVILSPLLIIYHTAVYQQFKKIKA